jgi:hypothetical protein
MHVGGQFRILLLQPRYKTTKPFMRTSAAGYRQVSHDQTFIAENVGMNLTELRKYPVAFSSLGRDQAFFKIGV